ncbi:MAG: hypothetical protein GF355_02570 [Candidatus Eisenbacteria bacterium]|nr:hypothetical protein [Candidatus Eisenbacteria bacterium]
MACRRSIAAMLMLGALPAAVSGAPFPERGISYNPYEAGKPIGAKHKVWLPGSTYWGEFATYHGQTDEDHAYNIKIGGFAEILRIPSIGSFAFLAHTELVAARPGDSFFRPRATFWEEGFRFTRRVDDDRYWQLSYMHRCKHDIDNLSTYGCPADGCERSLIYGSVKGGYAFPVDLCMFGGQTALLSMSADVFTILQDERVPPKSAGTTPNMERAWGAIGLKLHVRRPLSGGGFIAVLTGYGSLTMYGEQGGFFGRFKRADRGLVDAGISTGIALEGDARLKVGISYEYLADSGINPEPQAAHLVSVGVTLMGAGGM